MPLSADSKLAQLRRELDRLRAENARLARLLDLRGQGTAPAAEQLSVPIAPAMVTTASSVENKLALYGDRFHARIDVYVLFWENPIGLARAGGSLRSVAGGRAWTAARCAICP